MTVEQLEPHEQNRKELMEKHSVTFAIMDESDKIDIIKGRCKMREFEGVAILDYTKGRAR